MNRSFTAFEHAVICDWFGLPRPDGSVNCDLFGDSDDATGNHLKVSWGGKEGALAGAVGNLVLADAEEDEDFDDDDDDDASADDDGTDGVLGLGLEVHFLFGINWADSGPGVSWPERYHVVLLPDYNRYVVTLSHETDEIMGYEDYALGWFDGGKDVLAGAREVISRWWAECSGAPRWVCVIDVGLVDRDTAAEWADDVWACEGDVPKALKIVQAIEAWDDEDNESEVDEALATIKRAIIDLPKDSPSRHKAEQAMASCIDPELTPEKSVAFALKSAVTLGADGRCLIPNLLQLARSGALANDDEARCDVIRGFINFRKADPGVLDLLTEWILDDKEPTTLRRLCAHALGDLTGLREYAEVRQLFRGVVDLGCAAHDAPIYRGRRTWPVPPASPAMCEAARSTLAKLRTELEH